MGSKERREREREQLRTKILDAARELFATAGYEAVTMREIAARIDYSPTAIYLHFKDKRAVLRALCDRDFAALGERFAGIARLADPVERLAATGRAYAEFGLTHPNHYRLMFMTPRPPLGVEDSEVERGNPEEDAYAFLEMAVAEAIGAGRLRPGLDDAALITQTIWAAVHGVIALEIAKSCDEWVPWRPLAERVELAIRFVVHGLTPDGAAVPTAPTARTPKKAPTSQTAPTQPASPASPETKAKTAEPARAAKPAKTGRMAKPAKTAKGTERA